MRAIASQSIKRASFEYSKGKEDANRSRTLINHKRNVEQRTCGYWGICEGHLVGTCTRAFGTTGKAVVHGS